MLGLFLLVLVITGGSSRFDPVQIAVIRPISAMMLIPAFYYLSIADFRRAALFTLLLGFWLLWSIVQLIPLPPNIWQSLPGRNEVAAIDTLAGLGDIYRPLSLAPFRGWGAVFDTVVPATALLLALAFKLGARPLLLMLLALGLSDAVLGLLQVLGGSQSPLYLYSITNRGFPVGIFANENHSAVFSVLVLLVIARLALGSASAGDPHWLRLGYLPAFILVLLAIIISGSRAGLTLGLAALVLCAFMAWSEIHTAYQKHNRNRGANMKRHVWSIVILACLSLGAGLVALFLFLGRTPAFEDMVSRNNFDDLRWSLWPILQDMMASHWLFGTGFGSFDKVYQIYEPTDLLHRAYVNQAHNDWAQLVIEGGVPAMTFLIILLGWVVGSIRSVWLAGSGNRAIVCFWLGIVSIIGAASVVDYPLRTPMFQASFIWLLLILAGDRSKVARNENHPYRP